MADQFCLRWNNFQANIVSALDSLKCSEDLVDVTLTCEGRSIKAHKVILSACSPYFKKVFKENPCQHPVIILKDVLAEEMTNLLAYMYQGEVFIEESKLSSFLNTAALLQIKGLSGGSTTRNPVTLPSCSSRPQNPLSNIKGHNSTSNCRESKGIKKRRSSLSDKDNFYNSELNKKQRNGAENHFEQDKEILKKLPELKCSFVENNNNLEMKSSHDLATQAEVQDVMQNYPVKFEVMSDTRSSDNSCNDDETSETTDESHRKYENSMLARSLITGIHHSKPENVPQTNNTTSPKNNLSGSTNMETQLKAEQVNEEEDELEVMNPEIPQGISVVQGNINHAHLQQSNHAAICGDCPHCGKKYSNQSALKYHVRLMHSDLTNRLCCYLCPSAFTMRETFKEHMWNVHGQKN